MAGVESAARRRGAYGWIARRALSASVLAIGCVLAGPDIAQADQILTAKACRAIGGIPDSAITSQQNPDPPRPCRLKSGTGQGKPAAPSYVPSAPAARQPPAVTAPSAAEQVLQAAPSIFNLLEGLQQFAPQDQLTEPAATSPPPPAPRAPVQAASPADATFDQGRMAARNKDYCQAARVFAQAAREYKAQGDEARLNHTLLQVHMNRQQCSERQGPRPPSTVASGTADKCRAGTDPKQCVVLEQRGKSGRWHNYRLVNSCNRAFDVKVFSCNADWAGGCKVESQRVGACVTTGSVTEGKQSWDRDAELRL